MKLVARNKSVEARRKLIVLVTSEDFLTKDKDIFRDLAEWVLKDIAIAIDLDDTFEIRWKEIEDHEECQMVLHAKGIYIEFARQSFTTPFPMFMYRHAYGLRDNVGGASRWMKWTELENFHEAIKSFKKAMEEKK